jgi:hypothetical protein
MHKPYTLRIEVDVKDNKQPDGVRTEIHQVTVCARNRANAIRRLCKRVPDCQVLP